MPHPLSSPSAPVALILFNRADTLARVFAVVRAARPSHLFLIADGPRADRPDEAQLCAEARAVVADDKIDWPCTVIREFSDVNLGCKDRIVSGLNRLFDLYEEAIILEDDCLPDASFFPYATELLEKYRNHPTVMLISGSRYSGIPPAPTGSSYQSVAMPSIWGWATWRETWRQYDHTMSSWGENPNAHLNALMSNIHANSKPWSRDLCDAIQKQFDSVYSGQLNTWDYQLFHCVFSSGGRCLIPATNLILNIGFDDRATHTHSASAESNSTSIPLALPLQHAASGLADATLDQILFRRFFLGHNFSPDGRFIPVGFFNKWRRKIHRSFNKRLGRKLPK